MKICELKINDVVVERNPANYQMPSVVCEEPVKRGDEYVIITLTKAMIYYEYRQLASGEILNNCNQITDLTKALNKQ